MAKVKLEKDLLVPHPSGRKGTYHLVGRAGAMVDEEIVAAVKRGEYGEQDAPSVVTSTRASKSAADADPQDDTAPQAYGDMKVAELRNIADERGIEHDGLKKDELVEALEDHDADRA
jgi:hypothetical protein